MAIAELPPQSARHDRTPAQGLRFARTFTRDGVHPYDDIVWERRDAVIPGEGGNVFEQKGVEVPAFWSMTATNVVASKYFRGKLGTAARETSVKQMVDRVVDTIAGWGVEGGYFATSEDAAIFSDELKYLMVMQHASFNSPVWFNIGVAGVPQQASACFILSVDDSVRATDDFMRAALSNEDWQLKAVSTGEALETVKARDLLRELSEAAWACGDPGMQFDTTINDWHTCPQSGRINGSNPCSEYMHVDDSACNLASLNLMRFRRDDGELDTERFARAVDVVFTAQEILVGLTDYPTAKITANAKAFRQLGLGYANLGAVLMDRGLAYDSDEGRGYAAAITALMTGEAYAQSARIAGVVGAYDRYALNREGHDRVMEMHRLHAYRIPDEIVPSDLLGAARQAWDDAVSVGKVNGFRNAQASVLAPTGTISFMMDCDTTGVEPDIALVKYKKLVGGGMLKLVNGTVPSALSKLGYTESQVSAITAHIEA